MPEPRFFVDTPLRPGARIELPESVAHHAIRVLRLEPGSPIILFNGQGGSWSAILHIEARRASAQLVDHDAHEVELPGRVTLVQGIPGGDKMDFVIEKATELGATGLAPIAAQRSILKLSGPRLEKRLQHWQRVAIAACEQCGRNRVPGVTFPLSLAEWMHQHATAHDRVLIAHPEGGITLNEALAEVPLQGALALLVGPEGGWSEQELQGAIQLGALPVRFGPRILRTETAGLALLAASCAVLGWNG